MFFGELSKALEELKQLNIAYRIVFLEAADDDLVNRYEATRRRHPLAPADRVVEGIRKERLMMESLRGDADLIIDTTGLTPHDLRDRIREAFADERRPSGACRSRSCRSGSSSAPRATPTSCSTSASCRTRTGSTSSGRCPGTDERVRDYVQGQDQYAAFIERLDALLDVIVPGYVDEGKSYLTIAVGCTGGRHRSVVVAEELGRYFRERGLPVRVVHRDLGRD